MTGGCDGDPVLGQGMRSADSPRSNIVSISSGPVRRNSRHLVAMPERERGESQDTEHNVVLELPALTLAWDPIITRSKQEPKSPERLT